MSTTHYVDVDRALRNLKQTDLSPENVEAIHDFINHCAAEGLSDVRQERHIRSLKSLLRNYVPAEFRLREATEQDLKAMIAQLHRSDYADATKHTMKCAVKKFYKVENGGHNEPEKTKFFSVKTGSKATSVTRDDLFTDTELKQLFRSFSSTRDRAFTMVMYESAARPGEVLALNIADFTTSEQGDFVFLQGLKNTPDRTNQLVRAGRTLREWLAQHPLGGELGDIEDASAPLWVKTEQQVCTHCDEIPHHHDDEACAYERDLADRLSYDGYLRRFKDACEKAEIPDNKRRPYNLRHTRLTEVATFMGYEQLNKFAGWVPGSSRAKVYVHLNNDDVNQAIREQYGLSSDDNERKHVDCPFCGSTNQASHSECRTCGRPMSLEQQVKQEEKLSVIDRLKKLEEKGILDKLDALEEVDTAKSIRT